MLSAAKATRTEPTERSFTRHSHRCSPLHRAAVANFDLNRPFASWFATVCRMRPASCGCLRSIAEHPCLSKATVAEGVAFRIDAVLETLSVSDAPCAGGICAVRAFVTCLLRDAWQRGSCISFFPCHHKKGFWARVPGGGICKMIAIASEAVARSGTVGALLRVRSHPFWPNSAAYGFAGPG